MNPNTNLPTFNECFSVSKLTLNISKISFVIFNSKLLTNIKLQDSINYEDIDIHRESQVKYLGLTLDEIIM